MGENIKKDPFFQPHSQKLLERIMEERGVAQSYETAAELYEQAVQQGHTSAMYNLGVLYANGQGVETDIFKARELFTQAVALGSEEAIGGLKWCDDEERKAAALDPNAILCSFCGIPQTETRNFSKTKCPCKSTWYCNMSKETLVRT